jgi:hypothetical protein
MVVLVTSRVPSNASHEPANKLAAAGTTIDDVAANTDHVVLSETMKVSTPADAVLSATAECSILTYLRSAGSTTADSTDNSNASGTVEMWVTIDGKVVPVASGAGEGQDGEVVFCNRTYQRTITDTENDDDGRDEVRDFIDTRTANGFNWLALNIGSAYDRPNVPAGSSNNIVEIQLHARYTETANGNPSGACSAVTNNAAQEDCSKAFVGQRTLIVEPTNVSLHEVVANDGGAGS